MQLINNNNELQITLAKHRQTGKKLCFVPTMGNLHQGHLSIIKQAVAQQGKVIVSIFINPTQFSCQDDFNQYPKTLEQDLKKLQKLNVAFVFCPNADDIYLKSNFNVVIAIPNLTDIYCGAGKRGNFFTGVCNILMILFNLIKPDITFFGAKDWQQYLVVKTLTEQLRLNIEIKALPTVRELDGLAMSSRNSRLTKIERDLAACIYKILQETALLINNGANIEDAIYNAKSTLNKLGMVIDYFTLVDKDNLQPISHKTQEGLLFTAVFINKTRLIDNIIVNVPSTN